MPPKFLEDIVILCFERRFSKQNSVIHLKSNIFAPPKFFALPIFGLATPLLNTPPCLTPSPLVTWNGSENACPLYLHRLFLVDYQCFSRRTKHIGTFLWINFSNNFMCDTRSNAVEAAKKTACTDEPLVTKYEAVCFNKVSYIYQ